MKIKNLNHDGAQIEQSVNLETFNPSVNFFETVKNIYL